MSAMLDRDFAACEAAIRHGSLSFHAASRLMPDRARRPALALYAFCRLADDAVDLRRDKAAAVLRLRDRLDRLYAGRPANAPADRAFAAAVEAHAIPHALPEALIEGLEWDAEGRRHADLSALRAYAARVASSVGATMSLLMDARGREALARACDLGVAMQLTNVARDVAEDAAEGRLYLPRDWLAKAGMDEDAFLADPRPSEAVAGMVRRLLAEADRLYRRSEAGIAVLPLPCRPAIFAARHVYAGIGGRLGRQGHDPFAGRARTSRGQKAGWLALSLARTAASAAMPPAATLYADPLPETRFLVDAAAGPAPARGRADALADILGGLESRRRTEIAARLDAGLRTRPA